MTDREKLVELIKSAKAAMRGKEFTCNLEREFYTAEYLIAHGVTVKQMQKPLTVEELKALPEVVYIELAPFAAVESVYAGIPFRVNDIETPSIDIHVLDGFEGFRLDKYGKTWRCWAAKPTDEERQAAPWE